VFYSPFSYAIQEDPYPTYRRLRDEAPCYHNPEVGFWALSRFEDVWNALLDWQRSSAAIAPTTRSLRAGWRALTRATCAATLTRRSATEEPRP
jgi:cytochrome P450